MRKPKLPGSIPWLARKIKKRIPLLVLLVFCCVLSGITSVQFSMGTRMVIDGAVSGDMSRFVSACIYQGSLMSFMIVVGLGTSYLNHLTTAHLNRDFKRSILLKILRCEYAEISRYHSGDLIQRMNADAAAAYGGVLSITAGMASTVSAMISSVVALISIAPGFTLLLVAAALMVGTVAVVLKSKLKQLHKDVSAAGGKVNGFIHESITRLMMVQALDVSREMGARADRVLEHSWNVQRRQRNLNFLSGLGSSLLVYSSSFLTLAWCGWQLLHGKLSFGDVSALMALVGSARASLMALPKLIPQFVSISAACERIMEIDGLPEQPKPELVDREALYESMTAFHAKDLSFGYEDEEPVMQDVCLTIPKGGLTVIVGASGIGKSTLLKLLLGLYRPRTGSLTIETSAGSIPVSRAARTLFSYAPQGNFLLSGSLRENLTLTNPDATEEQIRNALYVSCMEDYVASLPQGLDTLLRENGAGLSEGQAQRLSLARAILSGAPVLLLDEVTSALDGATEQLVLERICALPNKTCIAVTHREAALKLADHVIEVSAGSMTLRSN